MIHLTKVEKMTDQTQPEIMEVQLKNKAKRNEVEKLQNKLDEYIEALTIIDSAISSTFLLDKHSLELQKWAKEYSDLIGQTKILIQEVKDE